MKGISVCSLVVFSLLLYCVHCQRYVVPEATLEFLSPKGLRISIPDDDPEIKIVAFHINVNEEFEGLEHGHFGVDIIKKRNGRWSYTIPDLKVKQGDIIYYWIHVIVDKLGYNGLDREYRVTQDVHSGGSVTTPDRHPTPTEPNNADCGKSPSHRDAKMISICVGNGGKVLLDEQFDNMNNWNHRVTIGGSSPEDEFVVFTKDSSNSWLENGKLVITPTLLEEKFNDSFVRSGELILEGCTSVVPSECQRQARHYLILPPILSARLSTKDKFSFRYGTVEIRAKLPRGNWIVPELWLEPVEGPQSEKVVIGLSRGNINNDSEFDWRTFEAGVKGTSHSSLGKKVQKTPWSQDFHVFKLHWTSDQIIFFVDHQEIHRISSENFSILRKEVYITLGVHVAGNSDFPDNIKSKPWKNSDPKTLELENYTRYISNLYKQTERFALFWDDKDNWYSSWNQDSSLQVEYVKVTAV